MLLNFNL